MVWLEVSPFLTELVVVSEVRSFLLRRQIQSPLLDAASAFGILYHFGFRGEDTEYGQLGSVCSPVDLLNLRGDVNVSGGRHTGPHIQAHAEAPGDDAG